MAKIDARYETFHAVAKVAEFGAWALVIFGAVLSLVGFGTGGLLGRTAAMFGPVEIPFFVRLIGALPGVVIAFIGLYFVAMIQYTRATVNASAMTAELLAIARRQERKEFGDNLFPERVWTPDESSEGIGTTEPDQARRASKPMNDDDNLLASPMTPESLIRSILTQRHGPELAEEAIRLMRASFPRISAAEAISYVLKRQEGTRNKT
jgi:hypothetical protein